MTVNKHHRPAAEGETVVAAIARDRYEAALIEGRLQAAGIRARRGAVDPARPWIDDNTVHVFRDELELAKAVLDAPPVLPDD
jgi:hypothetical protein